MSKVVPMTLSVSSYKKLITLSNVIINIADVIAMGGNYRGHLVRGLLLQLKEDVDLALYQMERDEGDFISTLSDGKG